MSTEQFFLPQQPDGAAATEEAVQKINLIIVTYFKDEQPKRGHIKVNMRFTFLLPTVTDLRPLTSN